MLSILFRCDATPEIGSGHVMRCLSLALELKRMQIKAGFVVSELSSLGGSLIQKKGFSIFETGTKNPSTPLNIEDCNRTCSIAYKNQVGFVIVDHYSAQNNYIADLKTKRFKVGLIDDIPDRNFEGIDWILNQNIGITDSYDNLSDSSVRLFGPDYALLRPEFEKVSLHRKSLNRNVLVTLGGGDVQLETRQILEALASVNKSIRIRVIGLAEEDVQSAQLGGHELRAIPRTNRLIDHMQWADISIIAGGTTCWEMCRMGIPSLILILADNQAMNAKSLEKIGFAINLGKISCAVKEVSSKVDNLLNDTVKIRKMGRIGASLVDGRGCYRASKSIIGIL